MLVLKNRNNPKLSEAKLHIYVYYWIVRKVQKWTCKTQPFKQLFKNIHPMTLASFFSLTKIYLQWPHQKIQDEHGKIIRTSSDQGERHRDKTPSHAINVSQWWHQSSVMSNNDSSDGESQAADITPVLADHGMQSKLVRSTSLNLILLDLKRALRLSAGQCASA